MERFDDFDQTINLDDWDGYDDIEEACAEFEIKDASTADWAISKIADERKRTEYFVKCAEDEIAKLKNQIAEMKEKCERNTNYLSGCLGKYLERDEVPKKKTTTQESVTLPAGKIIKKLPKIVYTMHDGGEVTKNKNLNTFISEIQELNADFIKTTKEVNWSELKKHIQADEGGNVIYKDTGEIVESLLVNYTLPSIEIKTE